ncbi:NAD-dependent epimerase/dehydratase family protein [Mycolicibacterium sp. XJ1819]
MLSGEKILVTGPAGRIAYAVTAALTRDNDVWGIARFSDPAQRDEVEALGVTTRAADLMTCEFGHLPRDFTYLLHIAANFENTTYDRAITMNAEATGFLLEHCRNVKAALVMSTVSVYKPHPDPWHRFREDDPLGDMLAHDPPCYPVSKIGSEIVARYCARAMDIPVVIARMNAAYNERGGLPAIHLDRMLAGESVIARWDPLPYSIIHSTDIIDQLEALLDAASTPATIVNWCGDEAVSVQEWVPYMAEILGIDARIDTVPMTGASRGAAADPTRRRAITGPCTVNWRDGIRQLVTARCPDRVTTG